MRKLLFFTFIFINTSNIFTQNIYEDVYTIFQNSCMPCHSSVENTANLNLEGNGATVAEKMADVYASIYKEEPTNSAATLNKNFLIYPGDPYRSFLYRKIDDGLTAAVSLHTGEGTTMPNNSTVLEQKEVELIRQWILYGALDTGVAFDKSLLESYYDNGGVVSIENPIAPPEEGEGFQIHLGPFYLEPNGEVEYFSKYDLLIENNIEVHKLQTEMGDFSHHYIVYKFSDVFSNIDPATVPYGMRDGQDFDSREFVSVDQYSHTLKTPEGSAFLWESNTTLDLNTHYINYSSTEVLKCEVFYNVYYQNTGVANQIMEVVLVPTTDIPIPNDNIPITFSSNYQLAIDKDIYVWGMSAHTHIYGKDFNIYKTNPDSTRGVQLYDAGCVKGIPGCNLEDFDYTHLPIRYFYPFEEINVMHGVEAEATFQNNGPVSVDWGLTSQDEMMIFVAFYVNDTVGVIMKENVDAPITSVVSESLNENILVFPNPANKFLNFIFNSYLERKVSILDISGRIVLETNSLENVKINTSKFDKGMYFYKIELNDNVISNGKFIKE